MAEHLIYVNNWFPKYEVDRVEQIPYEVFNTKPNGAASAVMTTDPLRQKKQEQQPIEPKPSTVSEDNFDLFGSDDEDNGEATKPLTTPIPSKPKIIGESIIVFDIKPYDDETDITAMEQAIRSIEADGLLWGQSQQIPVAFGIKKLQIACVVEDDKIGIDFLEEKIGEFDEYVQSIDIVLFNKK